MQNVYVASLYFFYPLSEECNVNKQSYEWSDVERPQFVSSSNEGDVLQYVPVKEKDEVLEKDFVLVREHSQQSLPVRVRAFVVQYKDSYFLAVGTDVDKRVETEEGIHYITEADLIDLRISFMNNAGSGTRLRNSDTKSSFNDWLRSIIQGLDEQEIKTICLEYALSYARCANVDTTQSAEKVDADFVASYFDNEIVPIAQILGDRHELFGYGLLHANDNYTHLDLLFISNHQKHLFSDLVSERFYTTYGHILFLSTHHPFKNVEEEKEKFKNNRFEFGKMPNVMELCNTIRTCMKIESLSKKVDAMKQANDTSIIKKWFSWIKPSRIWYLISEADNVLFKSQFNLYELDEKQRLIYDCWGLYCKKREIEASMNRYAKSLDYKGTRFISITSLIIAVLSLIMAIVTFMKTMQACLTITIQV